MALETLQALRLVAPVDRLGRLTARVVTAAARLQQAELPAQAALQALMVEAVVLVAEGLIRQIHRELGAWAARLNLRLCILPEQAQAALPDRQ